MERPNILFFFSDQQRWDTCGCYGQPLDVTPNLDRLASEGVIFNNAFTCQPVCGPARAVLQTGVYATEVGCWKNGIPLPVEADTMAERFNVEGYQTGYVGKWHLASGGTDGPDYRERAVPKNRRGGWKDAWLASDILEFTSHAYDGHMFDIDGNRREFPPNRYRVDVQTDWVIETLEAFAGSDDPFFLFTSYIEPHHQNDHNRYEGPKGSKTRFADFVVPGDLEDTEGDWRENYPDYLGCISSLDQNLGRIVDKLEELGIRDETLIIYTSDHGSHFRTRNGEYKRCCHAGCTHIPMVMNGPGFSSRGKVDRMVSLIDIPPTCLTAAGIDVPGHYQGRALQEAQRSAEWRDDVFIQISESQVGRAIRTPDWCYSVTAPERHGGKDSASDRYVEEFLYDQKKDPHERNNLVADPNYTQVRDRLRRVLIERMVGAGERRPEIIPA